MIGIVAQFFRGLGRLGLLALGLVAALIRAVLLSPLRALARVLESAGFRRGAAGSGIWLSVGLLLGGLRMLGRFAARRREVVYTAELLPGERLVIRNLPEDRRGRPVRLRR